MSNDNEEELPGASTGEGDIQSNPPVDEQADEVSREPSETGKPEREEKPKLSAKERLVKELSQPQKADDEDEEEQEVTAAADKADDKAEEVEDAEPKAKASDEDTSEHDTSDRRSKAKQRFEVLTKHNATLKKDLEEAKPFAEYGKSMFNYCKDSGLSTEKLGLWLSVAADAEKNPAGAKANLERLGIKLAPVREVVKEIPAELEDTLLDMTTNGQIAPEAFKSLVGLIRKARASVTPPPAAVEQPKAVQPTAAPQAIDPRKAAFDRDLAVAVDTINVKDDELAKKYPADWPKMKAQITEAMKRYRGTDPKLWAGFFDDEVAKAIAKAKRPTAPPVSKTTAIRPTTISSTQNTPPSKLASLKADLVSGKIR